MGNNHAKYFGKNKRKVIFVGLPGAGKTTLLRYLVTGKFREEQDETDTFNSEKIKYGKYGFILWDLAGKNQHLWVHHLPGSQGVVFIIDGSDINLYDEVKKTLICLLGNEDLKEAPFYIFINKIDLGMKITQAKLKQDLPLDELHDLYINAGSIKMKTAFEEGLEWLAANMKPL